MNSAFNNGAKLFLNATPTEINYKDGFIDSVIIKEGNKKQVIKPKIVFAADGFNSSMFRHFHAIKIPQHPLIINF